MTDRYERIRKALAKGPTPGPWFVTHELRECDETVCDLVNGTWIVTAPGVKLAHWEYDAAHIAACDPDTIRELLEERDAQQAEIDQLREQLRLAVIDQAIAEAEANDVRCNVGVLVPPEGYALVDVELLPCPFCGAVPRVAPAAGDGIISQSGNESACLMRTMSV